MKSKLGITLAVSHNIFLTHDQRYALADGEPVSALGVSVPVWYFKGRSSEPAVEVFNSYTLLHDSKSEIDIDQQKDGYTINIPVASATNPVAPVTEETWAGMTPEQRAEYSQEIPTGHSLRDIQDGGSGRLAFNQYNKSRLKGMTIHVLHFIRIAGVEELMESLV